MNKMTPAENVTCRYTGHKKKCKTLFLNCPAWIHVAGIDPNSGEVIDRFDCADSLMPIILLDNSQQQRETGAAVESLRNMLETNAQKLISFASSNTKTKRIE